MNKEQIAAFLSGEYPGYKKFISDFIEPLFDGAQVEDYKGSSQMTGDVKKLAERSGITDVRLCAEIMPNFSTVRVYDVTVKDSVMLRRNRVTVQQLVRKVADGAAAFIAFHHEKEMSEWRFSFCQKFAGSETNAKRYTFLLGPGQNLRTVTANFLALRKTLQDNDGLEEKDYLRCFDVESLSKEFFAKYKAHYEKFCSYVTDGGDADAKKLYDAFGKDGKRVRDYVKKMMGRLVFLQFLQKKGWLGVPVGGKWGEGDRAFLQKLFAQATPAQQADFLDAVLEPMFFTALNKDRTEKGDIFDTKVKAYGSGGNVRIPYLNGGLFTDDIEDKFKSVFPARFFSDAKHKDDPDPAKCGLLDFFAQYNFTIDENDPTEAEVGVDPEMLSCIFENLLEDNKDKGAFYTPKEIVEYMCRQSLVAYLQTGVSERDHAAIDKFAKTYNPEDLPKKLSATIGKKLKEVKVCDPAIGSGAFPMGMLRELFFCRVALGDSLAEKPAELKKDIIKNSIYGVDIEKGAVDIARLRFWLSLVVDEETPCALPNLDFKIMQGNSLLENYKGVPLDSLLSGKSIKSKKVKQGRFAFDKRETYSQGELAFGGQSASDVITSRMKEYYSTDHHDRKKSILDDINAQVKGYIKNQIGNNELHAEIDALECQNDKFFLWHTWFADVFAKGGFDIVIGNPPYIKEYINKSAFDGFRETSPYYMGKMDLWYGFACHGIDMLSPHGILCFIAQNNWTTSTGAKKMRPKVITDTRILQMVDFNDYMVFNEESTGGSDIQTMIMMFQKDAQTDDYIFDLRRLASGAKKEDIPHFLAKSNECRAEYLVPMINRQQYMARLLTFSGNTDIFCKMINGKLYLLDEEIAQGIVPNPDVVNSRNIAYVTDSSVKVGDGVFVVPYDYFDTLSPKEEKYLRPLYEPWQMVRYNLSEVCEKQILYITKTNWQDDAPVLLKHLTKYKGIMSRRRENQNGRLDFMHLHWPREESFFSEGAKILAVRKSVARPIFSYTEREAFVMMAVNVIKTERWDMKFLTGVLNSRLIAYWLCHKGKMQGENYQLDKEPLLNIPLPPPESCDQQPIIALVDEILVKKKADPNADTSALEEEIDERVFDLYGLTQDEREIVRGGGT